MQLCVQALISRVDVACQTVDSWAATAEELEQARTECSALHRETSSLRYARTEYSVYQQGPGERIVSGPFGHEQKESSSWLEVWPAFSSMRHHTTWAAVTNVRMCERRHEVDDLREKLSQAEGEVDNSRSRAEHLQEQLDKSRYAQMTP